MTGLAGVTGNGVLTGTGTTLVEEAMAEYPRGSTAEVTAGGAHGEEAFVIEGFGYHADELGG